MLLPTADPVTQALPYHSRCIFNEWPISRGEWLNLIRLLISIAQHRGLTYAYQWFRTPKKGWLTVGLLAMHESLLAWLAGQPVRAAEWLERSQEILSMLSPIPLISSDKDIPGRWLNLRKRWAGFWCEYIRLGSPIHRRRFAQAMEWSHE
jgi:hypothetical protein